MLPLFDPKWASLLGGYRLPYDPSEALSRLENGQDAWDELWNELHHQGDVGEASYAAVPQLVRIATQANQRDWNFYGLVSTIDIERRRTGNPPLPNWLTDDYGAALEEMKRLALHDLPLQEDVFTVRAILAALALCKGQVKLGVLVSSLDSADLDELVDERLAWQKLYE